jgi:hypothetical protein
MHAETEPDNRADRVPIMHTRHWAEGMRYPWQWPTIGQPSRRDRATLTVIWGILATLTGPLATDHNVRRSPARHPAPATRTDTLVRP